MALLALPLPSGVGGVGAPSEVQDCIVDLPDMVRLCIPAVQITAGIHHTCVLTLLGDVDCWGDNTYGQAQDLDKPLLGGRVVVDLAAHAEATCIAFLNGTAECWGDQVAPARNDIVALGPGMYHMCFVTADGNATCAGRKYYGANSYNGGDAVAASGGIRHSCFLLEGGNVTCRGGASVHGEARPYLGGDAVGLSAGYEHTCVLLQGGNVTCYGREGAQILGYQGGDAVAISRRGVNTHCVVTDGGNVHCWGDNRSEQAIEYDGGDAVAVTTGTYHTCVLLRLGDVLCWQEERGYVQDYRVLTTPVVTTPLG